MFRRLQGDTARTPLLPRKPKNRSDNSQEFKVSTQLVSLQKLPVDVIPDICSFLTPGEVSAFLNTSKSNSSYSKDSEFQSFYRKFYGSYCLREMRKVSNFLLTASQLDFENHVRKNLHVNIFHNSDGALFVESFPEQPAIAFRNYFKEVEKELNRHQYTARSFIPCAGEVGFEPISYSSSHNCLKRTCFNVCCNPSSSLRCGTPYLVAAGASALCCPSLVSWTLPMGIFYCAMGIPAELSHKYRLQKAGKSLQSNELYLAVKRFTFFEEKLKSFRIFSSAPQEDVAELTPAAQSMS